MVEPDEDTSKLSDISPEAAFEFVLKILSIKDAFTDPYAGLWEYIWWRTDHEYSPVTFWVNCNDLFYWACADSEAITPKNFDQLKIAVDDVALYLGAKDPSEGKYEPEGWSERYDLWKKVGSIAADLFCARVRGMRPQRPCYKRYPEEVKPLFDACGPERDPKSEG